MATLLLHEGVKMEVVSKILRHADYAITAAVYSHVTDEDIADGMKRLNVLDLPSDGGQRALAASNDAPCDLGAPVVQPSETAKGEARDPSDFSSDDAGFRWSGRLDLNQRPLAPQASALPGCATPR